MKLPSVAIYAFAAIALLTGESEARLGAHRRLRLYFSPNGRGASGRGGPGGGFSAGNGLTNPYDELDNEDVGNRVYCGRCMGPGYDEAEDEYIVGSPWGNKIYYN